MPTDVQRRGARRRATRGPAQRSRPARPAATGTLIRNTQPHQWCVSIQPPRIGPIGKARKLARGPDADRPGPLLLSEEHRERRQGHHDDSGPGHAEDHSGRDEVAWRSGVGGQRRSGTEQRQRRQHHLLAAVPVAKQPGRQHGRRQHEEVAGLRTTAGQTPRRATRWRAWAAPRSARCRPVPRRGSPG